MSNSPKVEPRWKMIQRVVAMLEKTLAPDAEVLHDQMLPNITTGHKRQCDVVIRYGVSPRQMTAIVEVQDRTSRVEIGKLGEWWQKMLAVGAQQLICVSALDYTQSVKYEVAIRLGPSVILVTLQELADDKWPFQLGTGTISIQAPEATVDPGKPYGVLYGPGPLGPGSSVPFNEMKLYKGENDTPVEIGDLIVEHFDRLGPLSLTPGKHERRIILDVGIPLSVEHAGIRQSIRQLVVPIIITVHEVEVPLKMLSYEQVNKDGILAWAAMADGIVNGEQIQCRLTFVPDSHGRFLLRGTAVTGALRGGYFWIPLSHSEQPLVC